MNKPKQHRIITIAGITFHHPVAFWFGVMAVTTGVILHLPMYLMGKGMGYKLVGMPMDMPMMIGMAAIIAGLASSLYGLYPETTAMNAEMTSTVRVSALDDASLNATHAGLLLAMAIAVMIDIIRSRHCRRLYSYQLDRRGTSTHIQLAHLVVDWPANRNAVHHAQPMDSRIAAISAHQREGSRGARRDGALWGRGHRGNAVEAPYRGDNEESMAPAYKSAILWTYFSSRYPCPRIRTGIIRLQSLDSNQPSQTWLCRC